MNSYPSDLSERAAAAVDPARVAELAQGLVRVRSVYDAALGTTEADAAAFVADQLRALGLAPVVEEAAPAAPTSSATGTARASTSPGTARSCSRGTRTS